MARSVNAHNIDLDVLCDWIEGCALFSDDEGTVSGADVVDSLCEENVYERQAFAWEVVHEALRELRRRQQWLGAASHVRVGDQRVERTAPWREAPSNAFCVAVSLARGYKGWLPGHGVDYTEQGELFEELTGAALRHLFASWEVHPTGWSRARPGELQAVVAQLAALLNEQRGEVRRWSRPKAKEAGLDLVCFRAMPDNRGNLPVFLLQCASGGDWRDKLHTPSLSLWNRLLEFAGRPQKAFAIPFALREDDFRQASVLIDGLLLDRPRILLGATNGGGWISVNLAARMVAWLEPRIATLPRRLG